MSIFDVSREGESIEKFKASGEAAKFEDALKRRINLVASNANGTRKPRNLFGLLPIKEQELLRMIDDDRGIKGIWVAGKRFKYDLPVAEDLVINVLNCYPDPYAQFRRGSGTPDQINISRGAIEGFPLDLLIREHREVPTDENGRQEFVPFYKSLYYARWSVIDRTVPLTYGR